MGRTPGFFLLFIYPLLGWFLAVIQFFAESPRDSVLLQVVLTAVKILRLLATWLNLIPVFGKKERMGSVFLAWFTYDLVTFGSSRLRRGLFSPRSPRLLLLADN